MAHPSICVFLSLRAPCSVSLSQAGDKANPIPYGGARDKEAMVAFIRENATPPAAAAGSAEL